MNHKDVIWVCSDCKRVEGFDYQEKNGKRITHPKPGSFVYKECWGETTAYIPLSHLDVLVEALEEIAIGFDENGEFFDGDYKEIAKKALEKVK